jgi:catechol 2,3-dioxygenase-like lactoylglutathione lyase family enzyme
MIASVIDHLKLHVSDLEKSKAFYGAALEPIGYRVIMETAGERVGFGSAFPDFWIAQSDGATVAHVAFRVGSTNLVDEFHAAALAAGGIDNGGPGPRPYHPEYYGAFVLDPDGNNIEACNHGTLFE